MKPESQGSAKRSEPHPYPPAALTVRAFCHATTLGRTKVYELLSAGAIRAIKVGRRTLIPATEVQAFLERLGA